MGKIEAVPLPEESEELEAAENADAELADGPVEPAEA